MEWNMVTPQAILFVSLYLTQRKPPCGVLSMDEHAASCLPDKSSSESTLLMYRVMLARWSSKLPFCVGKEYAAVARCDFASETTDWTALVRLIF